MGPTTDTLYNFLSKRGGSATFTGELTYSEGGQETTFEGLFCLEVSGAAVLLPENKRIIPPQVVKAKGTRTESGQDIAVTWIRQERSFTVEQ